MNDDPLHKVETPSKGPSSAALFVSLYLVILAFFILLNALSKVDPERTRQAVESVNDTFSATLKVPTLQREEESSFPSGKGIALGDHFSVLRKLVEETIHLTSVEVIDHNNTMQMTFSSDELFFPHTSTILEEKLGFMQNIAENLSYNTARQPVEIEFTIISPTYTTESTSTSLEVERAGAFARKMIELEAPKSSLSIGVASGKNNMIILSFYKRYVASSTSPLSKEY